MVDQVAASTWSVAAPPTAGGLLADGGRQRIAPTRWPASLSRSSPRSRSGGPSRQVAEQVGQAAVAVSASAIASRGQDTAGRRDVRWFCHGPCLFTVRRPWSQNRSGLVEQAGPAIAAGVVGDLLVGQAGDDRRPQVQVAGPVTPMAAIRSPTRWRWATVARRTLGGAKSGNTRWKELVANGVGGAEKIEEVPESVRPRH